MILAQYGHNQYALAQPSLTGPVARPELGGVIDDLQTTVKYGFYLTAGVGLLVVAMFVWRILDAVAPPER